MASSSAAFARSEGRPPTSSALPAATSLPWELGKKLSWSHGEDGEGRKEEDD